MSGDAWNLREYSTQQLIEELARRANEQPTNKPEHWCHECTHFVTWYDQHPMPRKECPDTYNPCTKGHAMKFLPPEDYDDEYGFYLPVCVDRDLQHDPSRPDPRPAVPARPRRR
ncbi:hypothetical protein [Vitreoscilla filiformis]|uniref:hypothetical protein n=1 Tax=Vitreoscilla filiformis TaxID=63 RepID=UPI000B7AD5C2|nr:hypothetical protein [Vitreoscilla filiformis]